MTVKKVLIVLMLVAVLTAGAVVLAACGNDPPSGENYFPDGNGGNGDGTADTVVTASNSSLIGYSAATSVSALAVLGGGASSSAVQPATETLYADNFKAEFEKQLAVIGSFIDRTGITVTEGASTEEGYAHFLSVTTKGLDGEENTFVLHYNISALPDYDRDFDDDRDDWDIDDEEKFRLDGVMTYGGVTYTVTGEVENEVSADETEHEIELIAKNGTSCIVLEYGTETETGEQEEEFEYEYFSDAVYDAAGKPVGKADEEFSVEFEKENGKDELEVEFISRGGTDNWTGIAVEYEAETVSTGTRIVIEVTDTAAYPRTSATVMVSVGQSADGGTEYTFAFVNPANWDTLGAKIFGSDNTGTTTTIRA